MNSCRLPGDLVMTFRWFSDDLGCDFPTCLRQLSSDCSVMPPRSDFACWLPDDYFPWLTGYFMLGSIVARVPRFEPVAGSISLKRLSQAQGAWIVYRSLLCCRFCVDLCTRNDSNNTAVLVHTSFLCICFALQWHHTNYRNDVRN